jgi:hypothetical protein
MRPRADSFAPAPPFPRCAGKSHPGRASSGDLDIHTDNDADCAPRSDRCCSAQPNSGTAGHANAAGYPVAYIRAAHSNVVGHVLAAHSHSHGHA